MHAALRSARCLWQEWDGIDYVSDPRQKVLYRPYAQYYDGKVVLQTQSACNNDA